MRQRRTHSGRRAAAVLAAAAMLVPLLTLGEAAHAHRDAPNNACGPDTAPAPFVDRDEVAGVHVDNVDCVAALDVAEGRPGSGGLHYDPDAPVNRDQMASFIARSLEAAGHELPAPSDQGFDDVDGNVHEDRINQLAQIGVVNGRTPDQYVPDQGVSRGQMASFVMRAAGWAHESPYAPVDGPYFDDTASNVHVDNIRSAYELWVVSGRSLTSYAPDDVVSRGAMGSFLSRLIDLIHPGNYQTSNQTFVVAPQEAITTDAGEPVEFDVAARYDGRPFTGPVDIVLFPCSVADATASPVVFADADDDQLADGFASTDADQAYISEVNGEPTGGRTLHQRSAAAGDDGEVRFTVIAGPGPDCAVVVVFQQRVPGGMRLDAGQRPAGAFGVGQVTWQ